MIMTQLIGESVAEETNMRQSRFTAEQIIAIPTTA